MAVEQKGLFGQIRDFLRAPSLDEALRELAPKQAVPPLRTSYVFDSHIQEASALSGGRGIKNLVPQSQSMAWDENASRGIGDSARTWQGLTTRNRKEILLAMYIANPWVSICADVIAKRITSGGISFEPLVDNPDEEQRATLEQLLLRVNDEWDFLQYVRASIIDECIFGETYTEIVWQGKTPYQLYKIDCITMGYELDRYGRVQQYYQQMDTSSQCVPLDANSIIRWWFPHPRAAMDPLSPMELVTDAVNLDKKMVNWVTTFFQKGAKFPYTIEFPGDEAEAERFVTWFDNNVTGEKNAHHPLITWGGAKITPVGKGSMDIDFPQGRDRNRTEVLGAYHVPPAVAGIIESGNIGGGTGEDQEKSFQYNTCDPIRHTFFEKFNDRVVKKGLGITDWRVSTRYADYRNDESVAKVQDMHIRNGSITINEARQEGGKKPYPDGDGDVAVIVTTKEITPVPRLKDLEDEARTTAQQALDASDLNNQLLKAKVEQANKPPEPVPDALQQPGGKNAIQLPQKAQDNGTARKAPAKGAPAAKGSAKEDNEETLAIVANYLIEQYVQNNGRIPRSHPEFQMFVEALRRGSWQSFINQARRELNPFADMTKEEYEASTQSTSYPQSDARLTVQPTQPHTQASLTASGTIRRADAAEDSHHTGMMLAFMLDAETANALAIPGGEPARDLHCTLAFLGDMSDFKGDITQLKKELTSFASEAMPLQGKVSGVGRFSPSDSSDAKSPVIALVDVQGLHRFRDALVQRIESIGVRPANDFAYTPHITLAYIDPDAPMPITDVQPPVYLAFDTLCLAVGDDRTYFKMGDVAQAQQESSDPIPQQVDFVPDDLDARLQRIRDLGTTRITWYSYPDCCALCAVNHGETRNVGEAFPNNARLPQCHFGCKCIVYPEGSTPEQIRQAARDAAANESEVNK